MRVQSVSRICIHNISFFALPDPNEREEKKEHERTDERCITFYTKILFIWLSKGIHSNEYGFHSK